MNTNAKLFAAAFLAFALCAPTAAAADANSPTNNPTMKIYQDATSGTFTISTLAGLMRSGATDDQIVGIIGNSPQIRMDLSADGLIMLKQIGVSEKIMASLITRNAQTAPATTAAPSAQSTVQSRDTSGSADRLADPNVPPTKPGIYAFASNTWLELKNPAVTHDSKREQPIDVEEKAKTSVKKAVLKNAVKWGLFRGAPVFTDNSVYGATHEYAIYDNPHAPVRLGSSPTVLFVGQPVVDPRFARLDRGTHYRSAEVACVGGCSNGPSRGGFASDRITKAVRHDLGNGIIEVRPVLPLAPGEYVLVIGPSANYVGPDFSVN